MACYAMLLSEDVSGHANIKGNEVADRLAKEVAKAEDITQDGNSI